MARSAFTEFCLRSNLVERPLCAEIGVAGGQNAEMMLMYREDIRLFLVDPYVPYFTETDNEKYVGFHLDRMNEMKERLSRFSNRIGFLRKDSITASKMFDDGTFDFVYIDADHSRECVREDIIHWLPKVKVGGMIAGHDYNIVDGFIKDLVPDVSHDTFKDVSMQSDWWRVKDA